ncbi:hypothetical protein CR513_00535, partial [Mucuna pruriens]
MTRSQRKICLGLVQQTIENVPSVQKLGGVLQRDGSLNMLESNEATMACFLHDVVELYHFASLDDLMHQATRVESKQRRCLASKRSYPSSSDCWNVQRRGVLEHGIERRRLPPDQNSLLKSSSIKCFKCLGKGHIASQYPNKRTMDLREDGIVDTERSLEESLSNSKGESLHNYSADEGDLLTVRRLLGT